MAKRGCLARLRKELNAWEAPPYIAAAPLEHDLQEWRFVLQGPHDSPYEGGMYQGKVRFPDDYPFKPPSIFMLTPNGRFETDRRLCLSISDFHPETWIPTWSVASIITGVLSFMLEDAPTTGSIQTTLAEKHRLRDASVAWNAKDPVFRELWPELIGGEPFTKPRAAPPVAPEEEEDAPAAALTAGSVDAATATTSTSIVAGSDAGAAAAGAAATEATAEEAAPGEGKNAVRNAKKRAKEKARKAAAAKMESRREGVDEGEMDEVVPAAAVEIQ